MMSYRKKIFLSPLVLCATLAICQKRSISPDLQIVANNSTHIARITKDTIVVISGSTFAFTVDTPEDAGLVSTKPRIKDLLVQIRARHGSHQNYKVTTRDGVIKEETAIQDGDLLIVESLETKKRRIYTISLEAMALSGQLHFEHSELTANTTRDVTLSFTAGQRSPNTTVTIYIPAAIDVTPGNITVNVIGRGEVPLKDLAVQSIGRAGANYPSQKVGSFSITKARDGSSILVLRHLDLRPHNGVDLTIRIRNVKIKTPGSYYFRANYATSKPEILRSAGIGSETAVLTVKSTVADFARVADTGHIYNKIPSSYTRVNLTWSPLRKSSVIQLMQSLDSGKSWTSVQTNINAEQGVARVTGLLPNRLYTFKLYIKTGENKASSNFAWCYTGMVDIKKFAVSGNENNDNTNKINEAISYLNRIGGGTLLFSKGIYSVRTIHLKSNVWLYLEKGATITALKGADAPETTWFSDKGYRSGLSPTDIGPYADPENYLTKQDVGHHYFHNSMFFGERLDNVKIVGNGYITGNGNLVTGDRVMNNAPDSRADKMFTFKLCTNVEIGGNYRAEDLWYDPEKDEPYYIKKDGSKDFETDNMLHIDRAGHFVLLATGTDNIHVHDTYFAKLHQSNARDIYDFMACNNVTATNIYSKVSSDDIIKSGSDCSLGFTRPASNYRIRNIIGDTNCNLFQIGSETADDITDVHVDNIYVLGANKAGFSISTNDGATIRNIHLNCGHTGSIHSRSKMYRTCAPFFISISNRARILGAEVGKYSFFDNGVQRSELLVKNVNIGRVENIILNGIDVYEVYAGSSFNGHRWKAFNGSQRRATPILAGYSLPQPGMVEGRLNFQLPNTIHTGYIKNITFGDVHFLVKGGNPLSDTAQSPPELGVGQYNVSNLKTQPSYGLWARHVIGLNLKNCSFNYEKPDGRYPLFFDDVRDATISDVTTLQSGVNDHVIKLKNASSISIRNVVYFKDTWNHLPTRLPLIEHSGPNTVVAFPVKTEK